MSRFIIRVVLHGATEADYNKLHSYMEQAGYSRTIPADDGTHYHLPPAEYFAVGNLSTSQIAANVEQLANLTGRKNSVLVSDFNSASWRNLKAA